MPDTQVSLESKHAESAQGLFLWDNGKTPLGRKKSLLFKNPQKTLILDSSADAGQLRDFFANLEEGLNDGLYAAGWLSYEAGYLLIPRLRDLLLKKRPAVPLGWFGLYQEPLEGSLSSFPPVIKETPIELEFDTPKEEFINAVRKIHDYIKAGDTYQINYTIRGAFDWNGPGFDLYRRLKDRQSVDYSAFIRPFPGFEILSLSPELFFARKDNLIWSRPMKGTAPRGKDPADDHARAKALFNDEKNRAENVMIVDLLRNDLGKICQTGSVKVPELFRIERYETLFQMTSRIEGQLKSGVSFLDVFKSLFPCGSITGAPKIRSMEIIAELEQSPRSIYTGAIGFITPERDAIFNVAIRTVTLQEGRAELGIGAGITIGSDPLGEYIETLLKAKFVSDKAISRTDYP